METILIKKENPSFAEVVSCRKFIDEELVKTKNKQEVSEVCAKILAVFPEDTIRFILAKTIEMRELCTASCENSEHLDSLIFDDYDPLLPVLMHVLQSDYYFVNAFVECFCKKTHHIKQAG